MQLPLVRTHIVLRLVNVSGHGEGRTQPLQKKKRTKKNTPIKATVNTKELQALTTVVWRQHVPYKSSSAAECAHFQVLPTYTEPSVTQAPVFLFLWQLIIEKSPAEATGAGRERGCVAGMGTWALGSLIHVNYLCLKGPISYIPLPCKQ